MVGILSGIVIGHYWKFPPWVDFALLVVCGAWVVAGCVAEYKKRR